VDGHRRPARWRLKVDVFGLIGLPNDAGPYIPRFFVSRFYRIITSLFIFWVIGSAHSNLHPEL
jgi:hypothetical protein